jgi:hypothetical protein
MIFVCVHKTSPVYTKEYVLKLREGFSKYCYELDFLCLSDDATLQKENWVIPLKYNWSGWWSKIELFRPDIKSDILYVDLDTLIVADCSELISVCKQTENPIMLSDFYRKKKLASGVMWIPNKHKKDVWDKWITNPSKNIKQYSKKNLSSKEKRLIGYGDGGFISSVYYNLSERFDVLLPQKIVSYKSHCRYKTPSNCCIICYHGRPRPHQTNWSKVFIPKKRRKRI